MPLNEGKDTIRWFGYLDDHCLEDELFMDFKYLFVSTLKDV